MSKKLAKSTGIVSGMTMLSRILGFVRDMVCAHIFGTGAMFDAFTIAFKIPNFMRRLFAEGAFAQAFVPVLAEYRQQKSAAEVQHFVDHMSGMLGAVLLIITIIAILGAPALIAIFAPGFGVDSERFALATTMLRVTFPYLMFISLTAFAGAILNTHQRFAVPAFTPVLLNISMIIAAVCLTQHMSYPVMALAWGVLAAGILQLVFQLPFLMLIRCVPKPKINWQDSGVRKVIKLMLPALFGVSVAQINLLLDTLFASFLVVGSVSWLYYSTRLMMFPLGIFGVAIATVIMPSLSKQHAAQSPEAFSKTLDWGLRVLLLIGLPASLGLLILSGPLLSALFQYGKFNAHSVIMTQQSLIAFAVGLLAFMLIKVLASGFYAKQNIRKPVKIGVIAMLANVLFNFVLIWPLKHAGIALATSLSAMLNAALLYRGLRQDNIFTPQPGWQRFFLQCGMANMLMAVFLLMTKGALSSWLTHNWFWRLSHLLVIIVAAILVYFLSLRLTGLRLQTILKNSDFEEDCS